MATTRSFACQGLDLLATVLEDGRLTHRELVQVVEFATRAFAEAGAPLPGTVRAAELLVDSLVKSRGRDARGFSEADVSVTDRDVAARLPVVRMTPEQILQAHAKATGQAPPEPPERGTIARLIVDSDRKRRGEPRL